MQRDSHRILYPKYVISMFILNLEEYVRVGEMHQANHVNITWPSSLV